MFCITNKLSLIKKSHILVWLGLCCFLFFGCAAKPSVSKKDLSFISQNQKLPLHAVVVFPEEFQNKVYESFSDTLGGKIKIGQSSVETFKKILPSYFEKVSFVTDSSIPSNYHIMLIPEITATASQDNRGLGGVYLKPYTRYKISFFDPDQNPITQISGTGTGEKLIAGAHSGATWLGALTLGVGAPGATAKAGAKGFSKAQVEAISELNDKLISSPKLLAYSAKMKEKNNQFSRRESDQNAGNNQSPELSFTARLEEPSGNYVLDAGEKGNLLVQIENRGDRDAGLVQIDIASSDPVKGIT
jgi:hypothetical protein